MITTLFFITSAKHVRNIQQLKNRIPGHTIRIITDVPVLAENNILLLKNYEDIGAIKPQLIIMFMAYPTGKRLLLQEYSLKNNISCIGIEEVHQLSLNNNRINHYFSPLDALAVPSNEEKKRITDFSIPFHEHIHVTGWGFFDTEEARHPEKKKSAVLFLSPLPDIDTVSAETVQTRTELLKLAGILLERKYEVAIKPHPLESSGEQIDTACTHLGIPKLKILKDQSVAEILNSYEFIINRGNSQICIEALRLGKKIIIYPLGIKTIFDGYCNVLSNFRDIDHILLATSSTKYTTQMHSLCQAHIPFDAEESLENTANFIRQGNRFKIAAGKKALHLSLLYFIDHQSDRSFELLDLIPSDLAVSIKKFLQIPYLPYRFIHANKAVGPDILAKWYLSKIYLQKLLKLGPLKNFVLCNPTHIHLPPPNYVPFFWHNADYHFAAMAERPGHSANREIV